MIVDTHAHFVRSEVEESPTLPPAYSQFVDAGTQHYRSPDALLADLDGAGVDKLVQVTPGVMRFDNDYAIGVARQHADRMRIVAHVDDGEPEALAVEIERMVAEPMVVGIRLMLLDRADTGVVDRVTPGLDVAAAADLPICVYAPGRVPMVAELARRWPHLPVLLDHAGLDVLPDTPDDVRTNALPEVLALVDHGNVALKVSGLPEVVPPGEDSPFPTAARILQQLVAQFGSERLLWGSNYPPVLRRCSLVESLEWIADGCSFLTDAQRTDILGRTACRVFSLPWSD